MYPLVECIVVAVAIVGVGIGLFLTAVMAVVLKAGWNVAVTKMSPVSATAKAKLRGKLGALYLIESPIKEC